MGWSKWRKLNRHELACVPKNSGVYQIACGDRKFIGRLLEEDMDCILFIGQSVNLNRRIKQFLGSISEENRSGVHSGGNRFYNLGLQKFIKKLKFRFMSAENPDKAKAMEESLLERYQWEYGEVPALNNSGGQKA